MSQYRRDLSSGMVHEADDQGRTHEADNLDDAGAYEVITEAELDATPLAKKCRRCFPEQPDAVVVGPEVTADPDAAADSSEERY